MHLNRLFYLSYNIPCQRVPDAAHPPPTSPPLATSTTGLLTVHLAAGPVYNGIHQALNTMEKHSNICPCRLGVWLFFVGQYIPLWIYRRQAGGTICVFCSTWQPWLFFCRTSPAQACGQSMPVLLSLTLAMGSATTSKCPSMLNALKRSLC